MKNTAHALWKPFCICFCLVMFSASVTHAGVVFDGSTGPIGSLVGDMTIGEDWGTRRGSNLFHSFQIFNINTGESLSFTSSFSGVTNNVIARVTGGSPSVVNGPLNMAIPGAALWLINPSGMVFGEAAVVDVQGSFYASTADYLLLDDGGKFSADLSDASGTVLTMGNPVGFGFLNPAPASIELQNASISVGEGESLMLAAGDISLDDSQLRAQSGYVGLVSVASEGELSISSQVPDVSDFSVFGDIVLNNSSAETSGDSGGDIYIVAGQLVLDQGSTLESRSTQSDGGNITISANDVLLDHDSGIEAINTGSGNGSSVFLRATNGIEINNGGYIDTSTNGDGNGGSVSLYAGQTINASGEGSDRVSGIFTPTNGNGNGGNLLMEASDITFRQGAGVFSGTSGRGDAGSITINADDSILLQGQSRTFEQGGIFNSTEDRGDAGDVTLNATSIDVIDGAAVITATSSIGAAGNINLNASGDVNLIGNGRPGNQGGLLTSSLFGEAGDITINAADLTISERFEVNSVAFRAGGSGDIDVDVTNLFMFTGGKIKAENSVGGESGSITISASDTVLIRGEPDAINANWTLIDSSARNGAGSGGVTISARTIELDYGNIFATVDFSDAESGDITLNATENILLTNSTIEAVTRDVPAFGPDIIFNTPLLELYDNSFVATNVFQLRTTDVLEGGAGSIHMNVTDLVIQDSAVEAQACNCGSGRAGDIYVNATGNVSISGFSSVIEAAAGIRTGTFGGTGGGNIFITANELNLYDGGVIGADSSGTLEEIIDSGFIDMVPGDAGSININANVLNMNSGAQIRTSAREAAGGIVSLNITDLLLMVDSTIQAEAFGVTEGADGGNIFVARPTTLVMNHSSIVANANAGNGGNIGIATEVLVPSIDSSIEASSQTGLDGEVIIESPNQQITDVAILDVPAFDLPDLIEDPCEVKLLEGRSSLTVKGKGGVPATPDEFQVSPVPSASPARPDLTLSVPAATMRECENSAP